jgi:hypothetical protein
MLENDVKTQKSMNQAIPQHDYRTALEGALSWLGNRYLLAEPLNRRSDDRESAQLHIEMQYTSPAAEGAQRI